MRVESKTKQHWDNVYASRPVEQLGWYEGVPSPSLELLARCALGSEDPILDIGAGASTLIDCLVDSGYQNIIAADISQVGLLKLEGRLGKKASQVRWIVDDVTHPTALKDLRGIALWHDRALLHFLVDQEQRQAYLSTLNRVLRPGGYVIAAAFSIGGARRCTGLDVRNYDRATFVEFFGGGFAVVECFEYVHNMPSGQPQPYTYVCMQQRGKNAVDTGISPRTAQRVSSASSPP
jgi:ubiquinone/menaquinone biosynthesis C-methylase UbiE